MSDITGFLSDLQNIVDEEFVDVRVPSLKKTIKFKPLTVKQHKEILKNHLDGLVGGIKLGYILSNIITENCLDKTIELQLYDKNYILIELRRQANGDTVTIADKDYQLSKLPSLTELDFIFDSKTLTDHNDITINLNLPSLAIDTVVSTACYNSINKTTFEENKLADYINSMLTYEVIKFITSISIKGETIDFSDLTVTDRKTIVEHLPLACYQQVVEYITQYRKYEEDHYKFSDDVKLIVDGNFLTSA